METEGVGVVGQSSDDVDARKPESLVIGEESRKYALREHVEQLSPDTKDCLEELLMTLSRGEASLKRDARGNLKIDYKEKEYRNPYRTNTVVGSNSQEDIERWLQLISYLQEKCPPKGVDLQKGKVTVTKGEYKPDEDFTKEKMLGKGLYGKVVIIRDNVSQEKVAEKEIMVAHFLENELRVWLDINGSEYFPALYSFKLEGNKVYLYMELMDNSLTLREFMEDYWNNIAVERKEVLKIFSIYVVSGLLRALDVMHSKGWTHSDLHGGNVMVQGKKDKLQVHLFDYGLAKRITSLSDLGGGEGRNEELPSMEKVHEYELSKKRIQDDLGNALRILIELYAGVTFKSIYEMKQEWKVALECVPEFYKEEFVEMVEFSLAAIYERVTPSAMELCHYLENQLRCNKEEYERVIREVKEVLFGKSFVDVHEKKELVSQHREGQIFGDESSEVTTVMLAATCYGPLRIKCEDGKQYRVCDAYNNDSINPHLGKTVKLSLRGRVVQHITILGDESSEVTTVMLAATCYGPLRIKCEDGKQYRVCHAYNNDSINPHLEKTVKLSLRGRVVQRITIDGDDTPILQSTTNEDDDSASGTCGTSLDMVNATASPQHNARKRLRLSDSGSPAEVKF